MTAEVELRRRGKSPLWAVVDDEDLPLVSRYSWFPKVEPHTTYAYAHATTDKGRRTTIKMHRLVLGLGPDDPGVDHLDLNGLNNTRSNLRVATQLQQVIRQGPRGGKSPFKGVAWDRRTQRWLASISVSGKRIFIGRFNTDTDAAHAYDRRALEEHGVDAFLNFPTDRSTQQ